LDDSIEPFDVEHGTGPGSNSRNIPGSSLFAVRQALHHYMDERIWKRIQLNGMAKDFSWKTPAAEYAKLYVAARALRAPSQLGQAGQGAHGLSPLAQSLGTVAQATEIHARLAASPSQLGTGRGPVEQAPQATEQAPKRSGRAHETKSLLEHLTKSNKERKTAASRSGQAVEDKEHGRQFNSVSN